MKSNVLVSPETVYANLNQLDQVDLTTSAEYREMAQEVLADSGVACDVREAIADRLNQANQQLMNTTVSKTDSY
jgi:Fe2+ or Zn2+ uptake regulation protein